MIDLSRLAVSLTKHGAYKLALLLDKYDADSAYASIWGVEPGINIDQVLAKKNLSVDASGKVPDVWNKARAAGAPTIRALVLIAILFSHHDLMKAMRAARTGPFRGELKKGKVGSTKYFSNTKRIFIDLGYSVTNSSLRVSYDFSKLFEIPGLHKLAAELLALKLKTAGWDETTPLADELINHKLNEVLSITQGQFRNWITTGNLDGLGNTLQDEDEDYFTDAGGDVGPAAPFAFSPGHTPKKTGRVAVTAPAADTTASLLHNELQTTLYNKLAKEHGKSHVRTELPTGHGTSIDVVVKTATFCWLYEIKVGKSLKACIRQAIPQLLEYAYWREDNEIADRLYIAAKFSMTKDANTFIELLRNRFGLPLYYEQIIT